jgi:hypothetical protein
VEGSGIYLFDAAEEFVQFIVDQSEEKQKYILPFFGNGVGVILLGLGAAHAETFMHPDFLSNTSSM